MRTPILRFVALFLVPCLLADPALAQPGLTAVFLSTPNSPLRNAFQVEALSARDVASQVNLNSGPGAHPDVYIRIEGAALSRANRVRRGPPWADVEKISLQDLKRRGVQPSDAKRLKEMKWKNYIERYEQLRDDGFSEETIQDLSDQYPSIWWKNSRAAERSE